MENKGSLYSVKDRVILSIWHWLLGKTSKEVEASNLSFSLFIVSTTRALSVYDIAVVCYTLVTSASTNGDAVYT